MIYVARKALGLSMEEFWRQTPGILNDLLREAVRTKKGSRKKKIVPASADQVPGF